MPGLQATSPHRPGADHAGRVRVSVSLPEAFPGSVVVFATRQPSGLGILQRRCCISVQLGVSSVTNDLKDMGYGNYGRPLRGLSLAGWMPPKHPPRRLDGRLDYLERAVFRTFISGSSWILSKSIMRATRHAWEFYSWSYGMDLHQYQKKNIAGTLGDLIYPNFPSGSHCRQWRSSASQRRML